MTTVADGGDVRPAEPDEDAPDQVTAAWVNARHGLARMKLTALPGALAWRVDEK